MDDLPELDDGPERAARVSALLFFALAAALALGYAIAGVTDGLVVIQMTVLAVPAFGLGAAMLLLGAERTVLLAAVATGLVSLGLWCSTLSADSRPTGPPLSWSFLRCLRSSPSRRRSLR